MANPVSGTMQRYDAVGLREALSDTIYDISPTDTPFMNGAGRGPAARQTLEEWQTDSLSAVDAANAQIEGFEADFTTPSPTVRVGNYTQIVAKTLIISRTLDRVNKAGRRTELAYQIAKRGREIKRDIETIFLTNQAGGAGGATTARTLASMGAWLKTNVNFNTGDGGNPTYTAGVPDAARTDGTTRAFTETIFDNVMQTVWTSGGDVSILMVGPYNKTVVSGFSGIATRNFDLSNAAPRPMAVIGAIDVIVNDFGTVRVVPNRFQRERDAWFLDWDLIEARYLDGFMIERLAKTGDAEKRLMLAELTLCVKQEAGLGLAADLSTS